MRQIARQHWLSGSLHAPQRGEAPAARRIYVRDKSKEFGAGPTVRTIEPKLAVYCNTVMRQAAGAFMRPSPWLAAGQP